MIEIVLRQFRSGRERDAAMRRRPDAVFVSTASRGGLNGVGRGGVFVEAGRPALTLALAMLARPGGLSTPDAIDLLYGWRLDGGPDNAREVVWQEKQRARLALAAIGFYVESCGSQGLSAARPMAET